MTRVMEVCRSLGEAAGFDAHALGDSVLKGAIHRRMVATASPDSGNYAARLDRDPVERDALLGELLVLESWFFRDRVPFQLLVELATRRWAGGTADAPLRVLCAPCAGGEEPYSAAMALAGHGYRHFRIDGLDLSRRGLETAQRGVYRSRAVRHVPPELATRFLVPDAGDTFSVAASLRSLVDWHHGNLLDLPAAISRHRYRVVFGRNVLIYLHATARERVLQQYLALLEPDGVLVVGHAETGLLAECGLVPVGPPGAFAFQRPPALAHRRSAAPSHAAPSRAAPVASAVAAAPTCRPASLEGAIAEIRALADRGTYATADQRARQLLDGNPACVEAHYLLGLIEAAQGRQTAARRAFERALYLDPQHRPSLQHLALLLDGVGEGLAAGRLRERASRDAERRP